MEDLYIVIESFDTIEYSMEIHGVFTDKKRALSYMKDYIDKVRDKFDDIQEREDFYKLITEEKCTILEIKEGRITN